MAKYFDSVSQIEKILSSGNFEELAGALENDFFEAKGEPWDLDTERGKLDYAKDVSALANLHGGIIVVGAATKGSPAYQREEGQRIRLLHESLAQRQRYLHVLSQWVYPVPEGFDIKFYGDPRDSTRGVIGVHIPDQAEGK